MNTTQPKVAGTIEAAAVRDFETVQLKMMTIDAAFRDGLPEGHPLRDAIHDAKWAVIQAGRLLAYATDPELAKVATPELLYPADSAPTR